tara:strand:- start:379 stop:1005 length:627 start_codon:yes stop_codon:yes gene_type:complete
MAQDWASIRNGIFAGESGGDYDALFGFSNRDGGRYSNVRLTDMTVDDALNFAAPSGDYGQWVKGQVGRIATPMGAYQVVGTTLRAAKDALGLTGNERMTPETQDAIGQWILAEQGTGAWEGYRGPQAEAPAGYSGTPQGGAQGASGGGYGADPYGMMNAPQQGAQGQRNALERLPPPKLQNVLMDPADFRVETDRNTLMDRWRTNGRA